MSVTLRYFAAARAAAGVDEEQVGPATLGGLLETMAETHGAEMRRVLARCSYLVDGVAATDEDLKVADGSTVDVLPPFAGG